MNSDTPASTADSGLSTSLSCPVLLSQFTTWVIDQMTTPAAETLEREQGKLYLSDAELIRRLGVPEKHMRKILPGLEK
jgi:hypothetical protein